MSNTHAHIGTGKFGLGFVGFFSNALGLKTKMLNRTPSDESSRDKNEKLRNKKNYDIKYFDDRKEVDHIQIDSLDYFDRTDHASFVDIVSNPETVLITTSIGASRLQELAQFLKLGIDQRNADSQPLFILACENGTRCSSILKEFVGDDICAGKQIQFLDCVVDQVCKETTSTGEAVQVWAEDFREWIIETEDKNSFLEIATHPDIMILDRDTDTPLDVYQKRKLWIFNGLHISLALIGVTNFDNEVKFSTLIDAPQVSSYINGIKNELAEALFVDGGDSYFKLKELEEYGDGVLLRLRNSPDTCGRVLDNFLLGDVRIKRMTQNFASGLGNDQPLSELIRTNLHESVFVFFEKIFDRVYLPRKQLVSGNLAKDKEHRARNLEYVLDLLIPSMVEQGKALKHQ